MRGSFDGRLETYLIDEIHICGKLSESVETSSGPNAAKLRDAVV